MLRDIALANLAFLLLAAACLGWARWRTRAGPEFPGPCPVGPVFKGWLLVIWGVGLLLPLAALVYDGAIRGQPAAALALLPYLLLFVAQVMFEMLAWKGWRSPVWVIVPCLFLPWRLFQIWTGFAIVAGADVPMTLVTLYGLMLLWIINIGVHFTNIPNTMRWDFHDPSRRFASLKDPRVFVADAHGADPQ